MKMMMNVFSSFNPVNFLFFSFILFNLILIKKIWFNLMQKKFFYIFKKISFMLTEDFSKNNKNIIYMKLLIYIFLFNMILNNMNLIPFSFCLNSQLEFFFFNSLIMWMSCIFLSLKYFFNSFFYHLTPIGSPMIISPFLVIIEMISLLIRPVTLSVRMVANMLAGHLLIHLLIKFSFFLINLKLETIILTCMFLMILNLLEMGVALIQPYIFCTLINMYLCENEN